MHVFTTSMLFDMKLWAYLLAVMSQYETVGVSPVMSYSTLVSCTVHLQETVFAFVCVRARARARACVFVCVCVCENWSKTVAWR